MERWSEKIAVVTGAVGGIGSIIVKKLLAYRVKVVGIHHDKQKLIELRKSIGSPLNHNFHFCQCDLRREDEIISSFKWIEENIGPISILINSAVKATSTPILKISGSEINELLQINVVAPMLCSKEAVNSMRRNNINDGHIINLNSTIGTLPPKPKVGPVSYSLCKHALNVFSQGLNDELVGENTLIRVTNLSPSWVDTKLTKDIPVEGKLDPENIAVSCILILEASSKFQVRELTVASPGALINS